MFDDTNIPHLSYYKRDDVLNKTYICYARRDGTGWLNEAVDSSTGSLGNYFWDFYSSIDIDTSGLPGITYIAWHVEDSLHYIKYAHYNGIDWDTSIVARDTAWAHRYPLDWSPSLKFDRKSTPHIAFHRNRGQTDTVKIGYYDDTLNTWIVEPAICWPYGGYPVSLALNSQDYPCIAHGLSVAVAYSWWDGLSWHTETTGATMGWVGIRIVLDLDSLDNPHILYSHWGIAYPRYCYKDTNWQLCGPIEPDTLEIWVEADISLVIDDYDKPHVSYKFMEIDSQFIVTDGFKYAKGTFVEIEEVRNNMPKARFALQVYPNPIHKKCNIKYVLPQHSNVNVSLFNVAGRLIKEIINEKQIGGIYYKTFDMTDLPQGIYFFRLETRDYKETRKAILLK
jgi:hypothetical protein